MSDEANVPNATSWLVMLYIAADDVKDLGGPTIEDNCNRMLQNIKNRSNHLSPAVTVVAIFDNNYRLNKSDVWLPCVKVLTAGKDWEDKTDAIHQAENIFSKMNGECELNSGNYVTLGKFVRWAIKEYNTTHTMLAIIGHGGGWAPTWPKASVIEKEAPPPTGIDHDEECAPTGMEGPPVTKKESWSPNANGLCPDYSDETAISTQELGLALAEGLKERRIQDPTAHLNVVFLDVCLMGLIEVACEIDEYVDYLIAGENLLWPNLPYHRYLDATVLNENTRPDDLAREIINLYNKTAVPKPWSIAVIDLSHPESEVLKKVVNAVNELAKTLEEIVNNDEILKRIRNAYIEAQKFDYGCRRNIVPEREAYVDLVDLAKQLYYKFDDIPDESLHEQIQMIKEQAGIIICTTAPQQRIISVVGKGEEPRTKTSYNDCNDIDPSLIIQVCIQIIAKDVDNRLDGAYGLSIYLPLGEVDSREIPARPGYNPNPIRYFERYDELRFAQAADAWARLLKVLTQKLWPEETPEPNPATFSTPRQISLD